MSTKRKKRNRDPLRIVLILVLLGLLAYKYQLFDGNLAKNLPQLSITGLNGITTISDDESIEGLEIPVMQSSVGGQVLKRTGYTLSYNADYKTPQWVAWALTDQETSGDEGRTNKFVPDPDVLGAKAYTADYSNSGYDRGHMAPAADMKWSRQAMEESFYLSNICPQNPNLNRGDWQKLEEQSRWWAQKYGVVYITCGPIYDNKQPKRIGANKVAVPDAFYKVILINDKQNPQAIGFIFPNQAGHKALESYVVTVDSVEKRTRIDFFPALPDDIENRIEAVLVKTLP